MQPCFNVFEDDPLEIATGNALESKLLDASQILQVPLELNSKRYLDRWGMRAARNV